MAKIFLPFMQAAASNAGPGGSKVGSFEYLAISALASATPSANAGAAASASANPNAAAIECLITRLPWLMTCARARQLAFSRK